MADRQAYERALETYRRNPAALTDSHLRDLEAVAPRMAALAREGRVRALTKSPKTSRTIEPTPPGKFNLADFNAANSKAQHRRYAELTDRDLEDLAAYESPERIQEIVAERDIALAALEVPIEEPQSARHAASPSVIATREEMQAAFTECKEAITKAIEGNPEPWFDYTYEHRHQPEFLALGLHYAFRFVVAVNEKNKERNARIAALEHLEAQIEELRATMQSLRANVRELDERPSLMFRGVWSDGERYEAGQIVTFQGSSWIALRATAMRPGVGPNSGWQLMVKRGRDGRDGRERP